MAHRCLFSSVETLVLQFPIFFARLSRSKLAMVISFSLSPSENGRGFSCLSFFGVFLNYFIVRTRYLGY